ncbi:MAG: type II toxin-antitoxin system HicA family toxin [Pseudomonadales bacterium]|nr:type II toxin-antitoxin system HicA family toxin [Pseudomonadales bacterium]
MNSTHRKTLAAILSTSSTSTMEWRRIEALFVALGAQAIEGNGSRVRFELNGVVAIFHRPHPQKEAKPYQIRGAKEFLSRAEVQL